MFQQGIALAVGFLLLVASSVAAFGQAEQVTKEPAATLVFPEEQSEADWRVRSFWPMDNAYGWQLPQVPDGTYRIVTRYGAWSKDNSPLRAGGKELEAGRPIVIKGEDFAADRNGFVSFQLVDLADVGLADESKSDRVLVTFGVKDANSSVRGKFSASIFGSSFSQSPKSNPRWNDGELHLIRFYSTEPKSKLGIKYDVFLVRSKDE